MCEKTPNFSGSFSQDFGHLGSHQTRTEANSKMAHLYGLSFLAAVGKKLVLQISMGLPDCLHDMAAGFPQVNTAGEGEKESTCDQCFRMSV